MGQDWKEWRRGLEQALDGALDRAFPEFQFRRSGKWWVAKAEPAGAEGYGAKDGKLTANGHGFRSFKAGKDPVSWADFLEGGGLRFPENLRELARLAGVEYPEQEWTPEQRQEMGRKEAKRKLLRDFLALAQHHLRTGAEAAGARAYLERRGFTADDLARVDLGFCPTVREAEAALTPKGHGVEPIRELLKDSRWHGRLVGAIRDPHGDPANLWARDLTGKAEDGDKYLYLSNEAALVRKGELVPFGLTVGGCENLILVEGVLDAIHLQARGVANVAALGGDGGQLSAEVLERLAQHKVKAVTLILDNDAGGDSGIRKALGNLRAAARAPQVWVVDPAGLAPAKDPDEYLHQHGEDPAGFLNLVESRTSAAVYQGQLILAGVTPDSPEAKRKEAASKVVEFAAALVGFRAELDRADLYQAAMEATGYPAEALAAEADRLEQGRVAHEERQALRELLAQAHEDQGKRNPRQVAKDLRRGLERLHTIEAPPPAFSVERLVAETERMGEGRPSGWASLDDEEKGLNLRFHPGELAVLGARTGHGKTSAMVGLAFNWALDGERRGTDEHLVFYSAEEPEPRIFHRLVALLTYQEDRNRAMGADQVRMALRQGWHKRDNPAGRLLRNAMDRLRGWEDRLLVVYRPAWTVEAIVAHAKGLAERGTVGAVLVDYLQRIPPPETNSKFDRRDMEVSAVARHLKHLAVELAAPVVTGAQVNRAKAGTVTEDEKVATGKAGKTMEDYLQEFRRLRPELHHLREGGAEQEVDLAVGLLNFVADWAGETAPPVTRFEVGSMKNRYGATGRWATLAFEGRFHLLRDPEPGDFKA